MKTLSRTLSKFLKVSKISQKVRNTNTKKSFIWEDVNIGIEDFAEIDKNVIFITQENIVKVLETQESVKTEDAQTDTDKGPGHFSAKNS